MEEKYSFETALKRLSEIVEKLESGGTQLGESIELFEEGTKISAFCYSALKNAEQKINDLTAPEEKQD